mgnify:CR=1 FL=1
MKKSNYTYQLLVLLLSLAVGQTISFAQAEKPHIFLLYIDDMNDYSMEMNGHPQTETPGISSIATLGTTFNNAHASSPKCAPSRTSMITGKDVFYTNVFNNPACKPLTDYFTPALNNETFYTLPGYFKDNGYFTYGLNKIYHCFDVYPDFDSLTEDPCFKSMSWSKYSYFTGGDDSVIISYGNDHNPGLDFMQNSLLPDSMEKYMYDYRVVDSVINFIREVEAGSYNTCDKPVFVSIGFRKPHPPWYIPEKYYADDYIENFYADPFDFPYNEPVNTFPYNGLVLPPQPDTIYNDYYHLGPLAQSIADYDSMFNVIADEVADFDPKPDFGGGYTDEQVNTILDKSIRSNNVLSYLAATHFLDAQINRFLDSLSNYPEIYNNSILIFVSDNGYSLGEKRHWQKGALWDDDLRVPFIIADLRNPEAQVVNSAVSLLDLFPTLCEMVDIPEPLFDSGERYLDGKSLVPYLNNPEITIEKPSLGTYKVQGGHQCSCNPQYSVRSDDFHYIYYTSNNADNIIECNDDSAYHEAELYEVGNKFITDPNEWNNLINNPDYLPVVNYLQQWLPDSVLYLHSTYKLEINNTTTDCFYDFDATAELNLTVYDTTGTLIIAPDNYVYRWTNNLSDDTLFGNSVSFPINLIGPDNFAGHTNILFFVEMVDTANQIIFGLDHTQLQLSSSVEPEINFNLETVAPNTITVTDFSISGNYSQYYWNFGYGDMFYNMVPGPITFDIPGPYTFICKADYGNGASCEKSFEQTVIATDTTPYDNNTLQLFPNPGNGVLQIRFNEPVNNAHIFVYNTNGQLIEKIPILFNTSTATLNTDHYASGCYIIVVQSDKIHLKNIYVKTTP